MDRTAGTLQSTALQVNLERTAVTVEIPPEFDLLIEVASDHYGLHKRVRGFLTELHHPFVNWEYVLSELRTIAIGNYYQINKHDRGLEALDLIVQVYFRIIRAVERDDLRETAVRHLFDFVDTVASKSFQLLPRNLPLINGFLGTLAGEMKTGAGTYRRASAYCKPLLRFLLENPLPVTEEALGVALTPMFRESYGYWLSQPDPSQWLEAGRIEEEQMAAFRAIIEPLSHARIKQLLDSVSDLEAEIASSGTTRLEPFLELPDFSQIAAAYLIIADNLERTPSCKGHEHLIKLDFLFRIMGVTALSDIHGSTMREINRCLRKAFGEEDHAKLKGFLNRVFTLLRLGPIHSRHGSAVLDCIGTIAREVFALNDHPLVDALIDEIVDLGFQYPEVTGSTTDWQVQANPLHIHNIRLWLEIIGRKPRWTKRLLSALIVNLKVGGLFVRDTDLLQKDISALLNTDIAPAYNLVKQLLRIFPVYFKEIGAEGELRDTSTRADELTMRQDKLVHFLRKQSHVESNSLLVTFMEDIFRFWDSGSVEYVKRHLPPEVFREVDDQGDYFVGMHRIFRWILPRVADNPANFLEWDRARTMKELASVRGATEREKERAWCMVRLYQLLYKKYNAQHLDLFRDLAASGIFPSSKIATLKRSIGRGDYLKAIPLSLDFLALLKERILSGRKTEPFENIYYKRHIAAGIPSMYGTYQEEKFDALGFTFRLESLVTALFEELMRSLNLKFITKSTLIRIHECLWLFVRALELEGISTEGLVAKMKYVTSALQIRQFSVDQYIDIFQFISKGVQDIIRDSYIDAHRPNLPVIIGQLIARQGGRATDLTDAGREEALYQHSESFFRSVISSAFGLQVFDTLINGIIKTLSAELEKFKENKNILNLVMAYNPDLTVSSIYTANRQTDNQILIGNKGYFLKELAAMGFPVPPGFIITTEVFRGYDAVVAYKYIFKDLSVRIYNELTALEKTTGRKFGNPENPLLLSVRSGATISLPGMMHSFLNVGINERIAEGLSRRSDFCWAAWDCYRRLLQMWGMFQGLARDSFDGIMNRFKNRFNIERKMDFLPDQMREIALAYREAIESKGIEIPDDPYQQLQEAIMLVFASWYSEQAKIYRHQMHLSDEWGTAVIVQAMIYGNLNDSSGSGVIFTRNPKAVAPGVTLYGDFIFGVQGDDIVSGLVQTYPISELQRVAEKRGPAISLESRFPEIYEELKGLAEVLIYEKGFNHQEIEFTFEQPVRQGLHILQTRDMGQTSRAKRTLFRESPELMESLLGTGIGVSGGALSGKAVYAEEDIVSLRESEPETPLILIRPDTVPDDVGILLKVDGLLTARGGGTSHAAVTIPQLNKVGVVGFSGLTVFETEGYSTVGTTTIKRGDFISIDGWSGAVHLGRHAYETGEAVTLSI